MLHISQQFFNSQSTIFALCHNFKLATENRAIMVKFEGETRVQCRARLHGGKNSVRPSFLVSLSIVKIEFFLYVENEIRLFFDM